MACVLFFDRESNIAVESFISNRDGSRLCDACGEDDACSLVARCAAAASVSVRQTLAIAGARPSRGRRPCTSILGVATHKPRPNSRVIIVVADC